MDGHRLRGVQAVSDVVARLVVRSRAVAEIAMAVARPVGRRAPEVVIGLGVALSMLGVLVLVGAARNDAKIDQSPGQSVAEVLDGSSRPHTYVRFATADGAVLTPEKGVFYPGGLRAGQLVRVEYDRSEPELVRVEGRNWTVGVLPVALGVLAVWALCGPGAWALARARRRRRDAARSALWRPHDTTDPPGSAGSSAGDQREDGEPELAGAGAR